MDLRHILIIARSTIGTILGYTVLSTLCVWLLIWGIANAREEKKLKVHKLFYILTPIVIFISFAFLIMSTYNIPLTEIDGRVCNGQPIADAADYTPGNGIHPIIIINAVPSVFPTVPPPEKYTKNKDFWYLAEAWTPKSMADLQLVACVYKTNKRVFTGCRYNHPTDVELQVTVYDSEVHLFSVKKGTLIKIMEFQSSTEYPCPSSVTEHDLDNPPVLGVDPDIVSDSLKSIVDEKNSTK